MSTETPTPRTDAEMERPGTVNDLAWFARQLERDLAAARGQLAVAKEVHRQVQNALGAAEGDDLAVVARNTIATHEQLAAKDAQSELDRQTMNTLARKLDERDATIAAKDAEIALLHGEHPHFSQMMVDRRENVILKTQLESAESRLREVEAEREVAQRRYEVEHNKRQESEELLGKAWRENTQFDQAMTHLAAKLRELEAERDALREKLEEREGDIHMRIRADYDKAVADLWRAANSKLQEENARLRASYHKLLSQLGWDGETEISESEIDEFLNQQSLENDRLREALQNMAAWIVDHNQRCFHNCYQGCKTCAMLALARRHAPDPADEVKP